MAEKYRARVNGTWEFELSEADLRGLDLIKTGTSSWHVIQDHRSEHIAITRADLHNASYTISIGEESFEIELETPLDLFIEKMGFAVTEDLTVDKVMAPMPGLLLDIYVEEGQEVEKDEPLLVLEAMKMENVILSPRKGTIDTILESKGTSVEKGTQLISFL